MKKILNGYLVSVKDDLLENVIIEDNWFDGYSVELLNISIITIYNDCIYDNLRQLRIADKVLEYRFNNIIININNGAKTITIK